MGAGSPGQPLGSLRYLDENAGFHDVGRQLGDRADDRTLDRLGGRERRFGQIQGVLPRVGPGHEVPSAGRGLDRAVVQVELAHDHPPATSVAARPVPREHGRVRILVTGHRGDLGVPITQHLAQLGHDVVGFDQADGDDLLDLGQVKRAAAGCAAVVHLGAINHDTAGRPEQIMAVNVLGTWHTLLAAEDAGAERIIHFSSAQAFGIADGERFPDYFPVDDAHPRRAMRPVASAVELALAVPWSGHHRALLCAADIAGTQPSLELAARLAPEVPVTDPARYQGDPERALVDCSAAAAVLGWRPRYRWAGRGGLATADR